MCYIKIRRNLTLPIINRYFSSNANNIFMLRRVRHSIKLLHTTFYKKTGKCVPKCDIDQYCDQLVI